MDSFKIVVLDSFKEQEKLYVQTVSSQKSFEQDQNKKNIMLSD